MQAFLQCLPFVIFSFGAPAFVVLAYAFWRKRAASSWLLRFFTICCATAFVLNLISLVFLVENPLLSGCRTVLVSVLPPLMLQLTGERAASARTLGGLKWLLTLTLLYVLAVSFAVARQAEYGGFFDDTAALMLAASAALAIGVIWSDLAVLVANRSDRLARLRNVGNLQFDWQQISRLDRSGIAAFVLALFVRKGDGGGEDSAGDAAFELAHGQGQFHFSGARANDLKGSGSAVRRSFHSYSGPFRQGNRPQVLGCSRQGSSEREGKHPDSRQHRRFVQTMMSRKVYAVND